MRIETDDYMPLADVPAATGLPQSTAYRIAKRLGVVVEVFGVKIVPRDCLESIAENRAPVGNPVWAASSDAAAKASLVAVESRMERIKASGETSAERRRNKRLAEAGTRYAKAIAGKARAAKR